MNTKIKKLLDEVPKTPGVYFFYNESGDIIYVGKASILSRRVKSYFQKNHNDYKTPLLVENIINLSWVEANSEIEALFLEAEYIKRYKPLYNVREKDDKNFIFVRISIFDDFPSLTIVRRPTDDKAKYYGPFVAGYQLKQALKYLKRIFPYYTKPQKKHSSKIEYQIGSLPDSNLTSKEYKQNIRRLMLILEGKTKTLTQQLKSEMNKYSKAKNYEQAAVFRNQYLSVKSLSTKIVFGAEETIDIKSDIALRQLSKLLAIKPKLRRIECYDISNFSGTDSVSSMVVFSDGLPAQDQYRHFKMHLLGPNDFAMMRETLRRRFAPRNIKKWPLPNLVIVDGGKGQLSSALDIWKEYGLKIPVVGLAKRHETIITYEKSNNTINFTSIQLRKNSPALQLLQRIRDESHRFAVSYHTVLRKKRINSSKFDKIPGVGPVTKKKLLRHFGSVAAVAKASETEIAGIVGKKTAQTIRQHI